MDAFCQEDAGIKSQIVICINAGIGEAHVTQLRIRHFSVNFNGPICTTASFLRLAVFEAQIVNSVFSDLYLIIELLSYGLV